MFIFASVVAVICLVMSITTIFMRNRLKPHLKGVLMGGAIFSLLGPPVGAIAFMIFIELGMVFDTHSHASAIVYFQAFIGFILVSYWIGSVPAWITGLLAGAPRLKLNVLTYLLIGTAGAALSFTYQMLILGQGFTEIQYEIDAGRFDQIILIGILPGFISGTVLAAIFCSRRVQ
ncbi:MAG: hypothetical protein PHH36_05150 [Sideroxydans sp.]|nr:hypothetical protein [Sideroxydans sp.]